MSENRNRKLSYQEYYVDGDYEEVRKKLPEIIKQARIKASQVMEPTIYEKRVVMEIIKDFIRDKGRKVYGGTALNETIKKKIQKTPYMIVIYSQILNFIRQHQYRI
ncbi:putative poly(A) polymerase catalytic subunit [Megavirus courdo11]|uniref:Putative poly(A) polymerase catalytic subunit n=2 Tax=Megavirus TaxID=3044761 RepID=K7YWD0_9VIRU|nr:putative poly(A) polymerase catalytic subunit [Megavirus courdo7]AFX92628.1 putative poly(A) polymerase catalytic subunit [Megavirus courdo11]